MTRGETSTPPYGQDFASFHYGDERANEIAAFRSHCNDLQKVFDELCALCCVPELENASCEPDSSGANVELGFRLPRVSDIGTPLDRLTKLLRELADKLEGHK